jgi:hypothetical protein
MNYESVRIRYERTGDKIQPLREVRQWIGQNDARRFALTRVTEIGFGRVNRGPEPWSSVKPTTRELLIAAGLIIPEAR